jgi:hypothetical protein
MRIVDFGHSDEETTITRSFKTLERKDVDSEKNIAFPSNSGGEKTITRFFKTLGRRKNVDLAKRFLFRATRAEKREVFTEDLFLGTRAEEKDRRMVLSDDMTRVQR